MTSLCQPGAPPSEPIPLAFELPPFLRESWVSPAAASVYRDRLRELSTALLAEVVADLEPGRVLRRRIAGFQIFALQAMARDHRLGCRYQVVRHAADHDPERPGLLHYDVWVGREELLAELPRAAGALSDELLSVPACCVRAAQERAARAAQLDETWLVASATASAQRAGAQVTLRGSPQDNPLLARLGLRVASHVPCSCDCEDTQRSNARVLARGASGPRAAQIEQLREVLSWPAAFSALHGIAELRLPVVRFLTHCAPTANEYEVRWEGSDYPALGAKGLRFPYRRGARATAAARPRSQDEAGPELVPLRIRRAALQAPARYLDPGIDWARLAQPQPDGYDTHMALRLAPRAATSGHAWPHLAEGHVAVRESPPEVLRRWGFRQAELDAPQLEAALTYLRSWPEAYAQFCQLIDVLHPVRDADAAHTEGSSSHHQSNQRGHIWATVFDALGLAQALVHELAHTKLFDLGLALESDHHLIINPRTQLFESPIRKDRPRPMSAVFHAQYSFIYVTALDLQLLKLKPNAELRGRVLRLLARNVARMDQGFELIERAARLDARGEAFVSAFMRWSAQVLGEGRRLLAEDLAQPTDVRTP